MKFKDFTTAELADGMKEKNYIPLRPIVGKNFCGLAKVLNLEKGDSGLVDEALENIKKGEVLIIKTNGSETAVWGDKKSTRGKSLGLSGVVIDGYARDLDGLMEVGLPVAAKGVVSFGSGKKNLGKVGGSLVIHNIKIYDGDYVSCDSGGLVVIRPNEIDDVLKLSEEKYLRDQEYKIQF